MDDSVLKADTYLKNSKNINMNETLILIPELLTGDGINSFRYVFMREYPYFIPKLRQAVPGITRNEEMICMFIVLDRTNDEIAIMQGVSRTSVNMARHRLRQRMKLPKESSLEDIVKELWKTE